MRNATLWCALLGVEKTVIESVEYVEDEQVLWLLFDRRAVRRAGAAGVSGGRIGMTGARVGGSGGRWTWARSRCGWKPTLHG